MTTISGGLPTLTNNNSTEDPITRSLLSEIKSAHNTDHAAGAHPLSWLATGSSGQIMVGDGSGIATWRTGTNFTMSSAGALTAVTDTALASPNNSTYKTVASTPILTVAGQPAGANIYFPSVGSSQWFLSTSNTTTTGVYQPFDFASGDYTVGSLTTKFRVKMEVYVGGTSPSTVTFNGGLYPATLSAGSFTASTVVVGSTTGTSPTPALATNTISRITSSDFSASALLSDPGTYVLGLVVGSITVPAAIGVSMQLQTRNA